MKGVIGYRVIGPDSIRVIGVDTIRVISVTLCWDRGGWTNTWTYAEYPNKKFPVTPGTIIFT